MQSVRRGSEGSSSWSLGEYAVSIRSDLHSPASLLPHKMRQIAYRIYNSSALSAKSSIQSQS